MKNYVPIFALLFLVTSCSDTHETANPIGIPNLGEIISAQIKYLDLEHKVLVYYNDSRSINLDTLKQAIRDLARYDIDSLNLSEFNQSEFECDDLIKKVWSNHAYTLSISTIETSTTEQNIPIRLVRIDILSDEEKIELLTKPNEPLEYLKMNNQVFNPVYESRAIGLDEAIHKLNKIDCR